jgi:hypothetical protein
VVVYCHCDHGNGLEAEPVVDVMVPIGFIVVAFDFCESMTVCSMLDSASTLVSGFRPHAGTHMKAMPACLPAVVAVRSSLAAGRGNLL